MNTMTQVVVSVIAVGATLCVLALFAELRQLRDTATFWQAAVKEADRRADGWQAAYRAEHAMHLDFIGRMAGRLVVHNGQVTTVDQVDTIDDPPTVSEADRIAFVKRTAEQMREERWSPTPIVDDDAPPVQRLTDADVWDEDE